MAERAKRAHRPPRKYVDNDGGWLDSLAYSASGDALWSLVVYFMCLGFELQVVQDRRAILALSVMLPAYRNMLCRLHEKSLNSASSIA